MIKVKESRLKDLENYGFEKLPENVRGHKYIWYRTDDFGTELYHLYVSKDNYIRFVSPGPVLIAKRMQELIFDLTMAGILEKE